MMDAVIKVGGSLSRETRLVELCRQLAELGRQHRLLIVPGGGEFADTVRSCDRRYRLTATTAHWMAILAMDQYGLLLSDLIPEGVPVTSLATAVEIAQIGRVPVLLPFQLLWEADPLPHSWRVTSDSISVWVAESVEPAHLILLKDVDGLFNSVPTQKADAVPVEEITLDQLADCGGVDRCFASVLSGSRLDVWVINGKYPERLAQLLTEGQTKGTHVQ
jgi:aspartokinase-like uncharacterized kinase